MRAALDNGWTRIDGPGFKVQWSRWLPFPHHLADSNGRIGSWCPLHEDDGKYWQSVSITLVTAASNPIMRVNRAPWISSQDSDLTLTRAFDVLADPASVLDR
jgi:hypothetical protein